MGSMAGSANSRTGKLVMSTPAPPPYCLATCSTLCLYVQHVLRSFYMVSSYIKMDKTSWIYIIQYLLYDPKISAYLFRGIYQKLLSFLKTSLVKFPLQIRIGLLILEFQILVIILFYLDLQQYLSHAWISLIWNQADQPISLELFDPAL